MLYAGINKITRFGELVHDVDLTTRSMSWINSNMLAGCIVGTELTLGALLIFRIKPLIALPALFLLISYYCGIIVSFWYRQGSFRCGCFSASVQREDFGWLLARNGLIVGAAVVVYLFEKSKKHDMVLAR
jgi:hypothetical protein